MRFALPLFVLVLTASALAQEPESTANRRPEERDVRIPMRDGKALAADLYLPPDQGKYPTVLVQTPYDKRRLGAPMAGRGKGGGLFDREHYAYVVVDWRGFFGSRDAKGKGRVDRGNDGYDCVEWIAKQAWSDGKVGTWGPSALGKVQYDTAVKQPPHLVCCVPVIAAMGQQKSFYFTGGVLREAHVKSLDRLGFGVGRTVGGSRDRDLLWKFAKTATYKPEQVEVPMLLITGWWDHYPDEILQTFADLKALGGDSTHAHSKILIGPWDHMSTGNPKQGEWSFPNAAAEYERTVRLFLDYWLRDRKDNGWTDVATVRYWRINEQGYQGADSWPGKNLETRTWPLFEEARELVIDPESLPPTLGGANLPPLRHGPMDQTPLTRRKDVLVWDSPALERPLRITGGVRVKLKCTAEATSFDVAIRLCILCADGRSMLLGDSIRRIADGGGEIELVLPATAATVPTAQKLRLIFAGGNNPRYEKNPAVTKRVTVRLTGGTVEVPAATVR